MTSFEINIIILVKHQLLKGEGEAELLLEVLHHPP